MRLSDSNVAIAGLGLIGASLGMALRGQCKRVIGVARRHEVCAEALRVGAADRVFSDIAEAAARADIVVLATPVRHIVRSVPEVAPHMQQGALLFDLGSTKRQVVEAMGRIPEGIRAVGGHPMCGKEKGGIENAVRDLFEGAVFALCPTARTDDEAMNVAYEIASAVGAKPLMLDAETHDRAVATISHLPYLLAALLVQTERVAIMTDATAHRLAASGFRDTSRLAASDVEMMLDILLTNSDSITHALDLFEQQLSGVRQMLHQPDALRQWMERAQAHRREMFT